MVVTAGSTKVSQILRPEILVNHTVLLVDRDCGARMAWTVELEKAGFGLILTAGDLEAAHHYARQNQCDLIFVDPHAGAEPDDGFEFIRAVRMQNPRVVTAILTGAPSMGLCFRAVRAGVSDFLVKGPYLSIVQEAARLLKMQRGAAEVPGKSEGRFATGLFSTVGVTRGELAILTEFSRGYPKQQDIARRLDKDEVYVRKVFSRVYKKLETYFPVNNQAQLSHIMTICSLFG